MNPYEYPDFWFPGCIEYECMVDPYRNLPPTTDEITELDEKFDPGWFRQTLHGIFERLSPGKNRFKQT